MEEPSIEFVKTNISLVYFSPVPVKYWTLTQCELCGGSEDTEVCSVSSRLRGRDITSFKPVPGLFSTQYTFTRTLLYTIYLYRDFSLHNIPLPGLYYTQYTSTRTLLYTIYLFQDFTLPNIPLPGLYYAQYTFTRTLQYTIYLYKDFTIHNIPLPGLYSTQVKHKFITHFLKGSVCEKRKGV